METFAAYAIIVPFYAVIVNDLGINICLCCLFSVYIIVLSAPCLDAWAFARCKGCPADTPFVCRSGERPLLAAQRAWDGCSLARPFLWQSKHRHREENLDEAALPCPLRRKGTIARYKNGTGEKRSCPTFRKRTTTAKPLCLVRPANTQPSKRSCARFSERPRLRSSKCGKGFCKSKQVNVNLSLRNVIGCKR